LAFFSRYFTKNPGKIFILFFHVIFSQSEKEKRRKAHKAAKQMRVLLANNMLQEIWTSNFRLEKKYIIFHTEAVFFSPCFLCDLSASVRKKCFHG